MRITSLAVGGGAAGILIASLAMGCGGAVTRIAGDGDAGDDAGSTGSSGGGSSSSGGGSGSSSSGSTSSSGGSSSSGGGSSSSTSGSTSSGGGSSSSSGGSSSSTSGSTSSSGGSSSSGGGSSSSTSGSTSSSGGSSSSSGGSSSTSGSTSSSGGSSSSSGGSSSSSGSSSGGGTGSITFAQCEGTTLCGSPQFQFSGAFYQGSGGSSCTVTTSGACSYYACSGTTNPPYVSAGTITIAGGNLGATGVAIMPDATNLYTYSAAGADFTAGQTLTISASGAAVPAFGPQSLRAPGAITLTAPVASGTTYTIATSVDLTVSWTGGEAGAQVLLEGTSTGASQNYFTCFWDASLGQATVPQAMLTGLAGTTGGYLVYGQAATSSFTAGSYSVSAMAIPFGGGMATFQ